MGEAENREVINRLYQQVWTAETPRFDAMSESFGEDAVVEYPQSGERIRGRESIRAAEENYPGLPKVTMRRQLAVGHLVVMETRLDYQGKLYDECSIFELRDAMIVRLTTYFAEPFEAPSSRARWVERM